MSAPSIAAVGDVSTGRVLARACAAEWTRLWSVRTSWWCALAAAVVMVGLGIVAGSDVEADAAGEAAWVAAQVSAMPAQFALLALALASVASDYATGGIVPTLQWTTRRTVLFVARTTVAVGTATGLAVVLGLASALTAHTAARPVPTTLPADEGLAVLSAVALVVGSSAALAVGLGFLLRSTAGALVAAVLLVLVLPLLLPQLGGDWGAEAARGLPGSGAAFLLLEPLPDMTRTAATTVLLAWPVTALLLGWMRLTRQDADR